MGVPCPRCHSIHTTHSTRRPHTKWFVLPPIVTLTCLQCGFQWNPGYRPKANSGGSGCGGCFYPIVALFGATILGCLVLAIIGAFLPAHKEPPRHEPNVVAPAQPVPAVKQPELNPVDGYKEIANLFSYGADELAVHGADTKDKVATLWMRIKQISSDDDFGQWLVRLLDRAKQPAADKFEEADRLVAQGQLQLSLSLAGAVSSKTRNNLRDVSGKLKRLFNPPAHTDPTPAASATAVTPIPPIKPPTPTIQHETKPAPTSNELKEKRMRAMLTNARSLIKAKVYPPARERLTQILDEAPGTPEANEAKALLDSIPK
jgi:hypothetical protein